MHGKDKELQIVENAMSCFPIKPAQDSKIKRFKMSDCW